VFNDKDVRKLIVVDDDPVDQRSQLIFLLDLILISVLTIHIVILFIGNYSQTLTVITINLFLSFDLQ
jgi:hypothetical protein